MLWLQVDTRVLSINKKRTKRKGKAIKIYEERSQLPDHHHWHPFERRLGVTRQCYYQLRCAERCSPVGVPAATTPRSMGAGRALTTAVAALGAAARVLPGPTCASDGHRPRPALRAREPTRLAPPQPRRRRPRARG